MQHEKFIIGPAQLVRREPYGERARALPLLPLADGHSGPGDHQACSFSRPMASPVPGGRRRALRWQESSPSSAGASPSQGPPPSYCVALSSPWSASPIPECSPPRSPAVPCPGLRSEIHRVPRSKVHRVLRAPSPAADDGWELPRSQMRQMARRVRRPRPRAGGPRPQPLPRPAPENAPSASTPTLAIVEGNMP